MPDQFSLRALRFLLLGSPSTLSVSLYLLSFYLLFTFTTLYDWLLVDEMFTGTNSSLHWFFFVATLSRSLCSLCWGVIYILLTSVALTSSLFLYVLFDVRQLPKL